MIVPRSETTLVHDPESGCVGCPLYAEVSVPGTFGVTDPACGAIAPWPEPAPWTDGDDEQARAPEWCPLRKGPVAVSAPAGAEEWATVRKVPPCARCESAATHVKARITEVGADVQEYLCGDCVLEIVVPAPAGGEP